MIFLIPYNYFDYSIARRTSVVYFSVSSFNSLQTTQSYVALKEMHETLNYLVSKPVSQNPSITFVFGFEV